MTFQSTVRQEQAFGVIGEVIFDGPQRARPANIKDTPAVDNTIGNAFTYEAGVDDSVQIGSAGAGAFAGILVNPKSYSNPGTAGDTLAATLNLPSNTNAEFLTMGTIVVNLTVVGTGQVGEGIFYVDATGALGSGTAGEGQTQIANAKIDRKNVSGPGLAVITLTEAE